MRLHGKKQRSQPNLNVDPHEIPCSGEKITGFGFSRTSRPSPSAMPGVNLKWDVCEHDLIGKDLLGAPPCNASRIPNPAI